MYRGVVLLIYSMICTLLSASFNSYYENLSLKQKVSLLFVVDLSTFYQNKDILPGAVIIQSPQQKVFTSVQRKPLIFLDSQNGFRENKGVSFPSDQTLRSMNDESLVETVFSQYLRLNPVFDGMLTNFYPDRNYQLDKLYGQFEKSRLVMYNQDRNDVWGILPLPNQFMKYQPSKTFKGANYPVNREIAKSKGWQEDLMFKSNLGFTLEDIISEPCLFYSNDIRNDIDKLVRAIENQLFDYSLLEDKIKWILEKQLDKSIEIQDNNSLSRNHERIKRQIFEESLSLVANNGNEIPLKNLCDKELIIFDCRKNKEYDIEPILSFYKENYQIEKGFIVSDIRLKLRASNNICGVVLVDDKSILPALTLQSWKFLSENKTAKLNLVLIDDDLNSGVVSNDYQCFTTAILGYQNVPFAWESSINSMFGGNALQGRCLYSLSGLTNDHESLKTEKIRLKVGIPEEVGMITDSLLKIESILLDAVQIESTPGCQVLIAKDGVVVYRKAFGKKTYLNDDKVDMSDIYDIASVTKIMATTPLIMKMQETGLINLESKVENYLPESDTTQIGKLKISELLRHKAGLPSMTPTFYNFINRPESEDNLFSRRYSWKYPYKIGNRLYLSRYATLRSDVFSAKEEGEFTVHVCDRLYMNNEFLDSIYYDILNTKVDTLKSYRYSDRGFNLLQYIIERKMKKPLNILADSLIYKPLGLERIGYLPRSKFSLSRIVPTEYDKVFRKQLLRGYVHDPGAAILGGVAGNAGIFSNVDDLAVMMQMYLNHGVYGGVRLFRSETVDMFTRQYAEDNRRGLGFDKPEPDTLRVSPVCEEASLKSFGHLGFTGTIVWADPENKLLFVFLSNRVHPYSWNSKLTDGNFRTKILAQAYHSIKK